MHRKTHTLTDSQLTLCWYITHWYYSSSQNALHSPQTNIQRYTNTDRHLTHYLMVYHTVASPFFKTRTICIWRTFLQHVYQRYIEKHMQTHTQRHTHKHTSNFTLTLLPDVISHAGLAIL